MKFKNIIGITICIKKGAQLNERRKNEKKIKEKNKCYLEK